MNDEPLMLDRESETRQGVDCSKLKPNIIESVRDTKLPSGWERLQPQKSGPLWTGEQTSTNWVDLEAD